MRFADLKARIKKIEIANTVHSDSWMQSIRLILEDIDLTNENLMELRQFRPNEQVYVEIRPVQTSLFEQTPTDESLNGDKPDKEFETFTEGDQVEGQILKRWDF